MRRGAWVITLALCGSLAAAAPDGGTAMDLRSLLTTARERDRAYRAPTAKELAAFRAGVTPLLASGDASPQLAEAGFTVERTTLGGAPALALAELEGRRRGGGVYVLRTGAVPRERIVQVPHSFFDEGTLPIGLALAEAGAARGLFVNTVHRYQAGRPRSPAADESSGGDASPSDLAHQRRTFFQAMTDAALARFPGAQVVQIHGFKEGATGARARAEVVVSAGAARGGADEAARVAGRLAALLGADRVLLYPRDTRLLGAQTNAQGEAVARHPPATFLHLELARALRDRLVSDGPLREKFGRAVFAESP